MGMDLESILKSSNLDLTDPAAGVMLYYDGDTALWCVYRSVEPVGERLSEYSEFKYAQAYLAEILGL